MRRVTYTACAVKNEKLAFLSDDTRYRLRFAMQIGGWAMMDELYAGLTPLFWQRDVNRPGVPMPIGVVNILISLMLEGSNVGACSYDRYLAAQKSWIAQGRSGVKTRKAHFEQFSAASPRTAGTVQRVRGLARSRARARG
jgi:hypothetical protein